MAEAETTFAVLAWELIPCDTTDLELCFKVMNVNETIVRLGDANHPGCNLSPRQQVRMVLVRTNKDDLKSVYNISCCHNSQTSDTASITTSL